MDEGFTYEVKTECDQMRVLVPEGKIALAVTAARENGLRGQYVGTRLIQMPGNDRGRVNA